MKKKDGIPNRRRRGQRGFTLVEALLSLAITALLMTALGAAVFTTLKSYSENERIATSTQVARAVLQRMMKDVRSCADANASGSTIFILPADANITQIAYRYDASAKQLYYDKTVGGVTYSYPACGENGTVTGFSIATQTGLDWQGFSCIKSLRVTLTLRLGGETFTFTSSASPRRNQVF